MYVFMKIVANMTKIGVNIRKCTVGTGQRYSIQDPDLFQGENSGASEMSGDVCRGN
jgi:hypothetical protein